MTMKRLLVTAAVLSLLVPSLVLAADEAEQVPAPDFIPYYKNIEQKGNALFGHKTMTMEEMKAKIAEKQAAKKAELEKKQTEKKTGQEQKQTEKKLEKIPVPGMIKFFEGIRQQGNALWGFIKDSWGYGLGNLTKENASCVALAVSNRDGSVRAAIVANDSAMLTAFDARSSCAQTAFTQSALKDIVTGLVKCNTDFVKARDAANKTMATARDSAWKLFREELKDCGGRINPKLQEASGPTQELLGALDDQEIDDVAETTEEPSSGTDE
jgi:hypothetical protein